MKYPFYMLCLFCSFLSLSGFAQAPPCPPNIDFENGSLANWNFFNGTTATGPVYTLFASPPVSGREDLMSGPGVDPYGFFPIVGAGAYSCRLGHDTINYCAEKASYTIRIPAGISNYSLIYRYAMVLNDGGHLPPDQPRFLVSAYDSATGGPVPCAQYNYVASASLPGFVLSTVGFNVFYRPWSTASMNLSGYGGRTVIIDFTAADCGQGGHFGYGYLDMSCGLFAVTTTSCNDTTVTLRAPAGYSTYTWYDSSSFTTVYGTTDTVVIPMPVVPTTYAVILDPYVGFGCRDTLYTRVIPTHLRMHASNDSVVCIGSGVSLTSGATDIALPLSYAWSGTPGTLSCSSCDPVIVTPLLGSHLYTVTVTDAAGCSLTDTIRLGANGVIPAITTRNVSCYGRSDGTATATPTSGTAPFVYSWATTPVQTTATATGLAAGTYTVNITDSTGCTSHTPVTITQPPPTVLSVIASSNPTTCFGSDGTITIGGLVPSTTFNIRFRFNGVPQTRSLLATGTGTVVLVGLLSGIYDSITVLGTLCPYNTVGPVVLTDPPIPPPPPVTPQTYCQYEVAQPLIAVGSNLVWYGPGITGSTATPVPTTDTPGTVYYYVTQTVAGCLSGRSLDSVMVYPKPAPPLTVDTTYCQFFAAPALTATGSNLAWYKGHNGGTAITPTPVPSTAIPGNEVWYVDQTVHGCVSDRTSIKVTTLYKPLFTIAPGSLWVCEHDSVTFAYDGPVLVNPAYAWTLTTGTGISYAGHTNPSDSMINVKFDAVDLRNYIHLYASDYGGRCFSDTVIRIRVVPQPAAASGTRQDVCLGDTVALALASKTDNAAEFTWRIDYNTFMASSGALNIIAHDSHSGGPFSISWTDAGRHVIQLNCATVEGCKSDPTYDTVNVHMLPDATFNVVTRPGTLCLEDSVYFAANTTDYNYSYQWAPVHFFSNVNKPAIWGRVEQTRSEVSLTVTDPFGCQASASQQIDPSSCCTISLPNAFTPNGDGKNDVFRPIRDFKTNSGYHRYHTFRIANRWGQVVFESANNLAEWDGNYNGVPQDMGVYFYYLKYDCGGKTMEQTGDVTLVR